MHPACATQQRRLTNFSMLLRVCRGPDRTLVIHLCHMHRHHRIESPECAVHVGNNLGLPVPSVMTEVHQLLRTLMLYTFAAHLDVIQVGPVAEQPGEQGDVLLSLAVAHPMVQEGGLRHNALCRRDRADRQGACAHVCVDV